MVLELGADGGGARLIRRCREVLASASVRGLERYREERRQRYPRLDELGRPPRALAQHPSDVGEDESRD